MLSEHFYAAISSPSKTADASRNKDGGIFFHQLHPLAGQKAVLKKSATPPNCLAVSQTHVYSSQLEKAVIHVYNRDKSNQEAIVPFQERIHAVALAVGDSVLVLGTESGRVLLWETYSGRLVSAAASHLQQVNVIAVDPRSNFLLTGSQDSNINVWSLPKLLSFSSSSELRSPIRSLSTHRGAITALTCGHSYSPANVAISASRDNSVIIWNYHDGLILRTYLLGDTPLSLALDPADRAFYTTYEDGSVQMVDFYDEAQQRTSTNMIHNSQSSSTSVIEPPKSSRWTAESQNLGRGICVALSWDGTTLLSGHESGKIARWDVARGLWQSTIATLPGPVTNLQFLTPDGFPNSIGHPLKIQNVVKPRHDNFKQDEPGLIPGSYTLCTQINRAITFPRLSENAMSTTNPSCFTAALNHPSLPEDLLSESLAELYSWSSVPQKGSQVPVAEEADFLSFEDVGAESTGPRQVDQSEQMKALQSQLEALQRIQRVSFKQLAELRRERDWWVEKEERKEKRRAARLANTTPKDNGPATEAQGDEMDLDFDNKPDNHEDADEATSVDELDRSLGRNSPEYISTDEEERLRRKAVRKGKQKAKK